MSSETPITDDPFLLTQLEKETEMVALKNTLKLAQGFKLLFVQCNNPSYRRQLMSELRQEVSHLNIQEILFTKPVTQLLDELRLLISEPPPDAIFVSGLEYSLPVAAEAHQTPFIANLNSSRNSFGNALSCPLILWAPEYVLTAIIQGAPDFFSVRSGVYFFTSSPDEIATHESSLMSVSWNTEIDMTLSEKQERIKAIESLLADLKDLPEEKRDDSMELRLRERLGGLLNGLSYFNAAQKQFEKILVMAQKLKDSAWEKYALRSIANSQTEQGFLEEAERNYHKALEIPEQMNWEDANIQSGLGDLYLIRKRYSEAEQAFQQSLNIARDIADRAAEARILSNLGKVYLEQGRLSEAEEILSQVLVILREKGGRADEATILLNLGKVYSQQGRIEEAKNSLEQALQIFDAVGSASNKGVSLFFLAEHYYSQQDLDEALKYAQQAVEVFEKTQDPPRLAEARAFFEIIKQQIEAQTEAAKQPDQN